MFTLQHTFHLLLFNIPQADGTIGITNGKNVLLWTSADFWNLRLAIAQSADLQVTLPNKPYLRAKLNIPDVQLLECSRNGHRSVVTKEDIRIRGRNQAQCTIVCISLIAVLHRVSNIPKEYAQNQPEKNSCGLNERRTIFALEIGIPDIFDGPLARFWSRILSWLLSSKGGKSEASIMKGLNRKPPRQKIGWRLKRMFLPWTSQRRMCRNMVGDGRRAWHLVRQKLKAFIANSLLKFEKRVVVGSLLEG